MLIKWGHMEWHTNPFKNRQWSRGLFPFLLLTQRSSVLGQMPDFFTAYFPKFWPYCSSLLWHNTNESTSLQHPLMPPPAREAGSQVQWNFIATKKHCPASRVLPSGGWHQCCYENHWVFPILILTSQLLLILPDIDYLNQSYSSFSTLLVHLFFWNKGLKFGWKMF